MNREILISGSGAVHWRFYGTALAQEFFKLVESLQDMSRRWKGCMPEQTERMDLAARYASLLQALHTKCLNEPDLRPELLFQYDITSDLDAKAGRDRSFSVTGLEESSRPTGQDVASSAVEGYPAQRVDCSPASSRGYAHTFPAQNPTSPYNPNPHAEGSLYNHISPSNANPSIGHPTPRPAPTGVPSHLSSPASNTQSIPATVPLREHTGIENSNERQTVDRADATEDELTIMSNALLGQQFSELDRVITLDGTDFAFDMSMSYGYGWPA